ncbi:LysR family transcriptional regulator [Vibrio sp. 99-70-13A1]|uniref:LysR family transcriptional regulator n=1 Tax=Vibrio sp. 99-70-13A1 TaxID=2607601 RepID=UPI00149335A1|nr:LysR family transcriptional regulator [Vibrio sp. 99-70-13A1]NOH98719.1 LysR family transcriptional regulator [Vibrio sp. 99-70-13A1]
MNIEHLKLFVRLASTNNISLAGQELGLSPAVASAHIGKLEKALNVRLVHRTTRKVSLTEEGLAFLPHAEEVLESVEAAQAAVGAGNQMPKGVLRVSAPASFGRMHLIPAMQAFMDAHPGLKVDYRLSDSIIDLVEGGFDIAIRNAALKDSTLVARKLAFDQRIVCTSPDYIKKHGQPTHPNELLNHNFVNLSGFDNWTFETPEGHVTIKPKGEFKADNGEAVRDACAHGLGITVSSTWCCHEHLKRGELVPILEEYPLVSDSAIWAVYPSSRLLAPKVRAFIDFFTDYFGKTPYWDKK